MDHLNRLGDMFFAVAFNLSTLILLFVLGVAATAAVFMFKCFFSMLFEQNRLGFSWAGVFICLAAGLFFSAITIYVTSLFVQAVRLAM